MPRYKRFKNVDKNAEMPTEKQLANLQPKPFTSENQPAKNGRKKGVPNRSTVYKRILETKMKVKQVNGEEKTMTLYEAIALGQAQSAMKGNTNAWKEIQDSIHGKMPDKIESDSNVNVNLSGEVAVRIDKIYGQDGD